MSIWERLREVSDASRRRIKTIAQDALDGVDEIESRALDNSPAAQARAIVQTGASPPMASASFSGSLDMLVPPLPAPPSSPASAPSDSLDWVGPPAPEFPGGMEFEDESVPSRCFPNSMGFSDEEIETLLRVEHYPRLAKLDVNLLHQLACIEGTLLASSKQVGRAWLGLIGGFVDEEEIWEETLYFTGAHHDVGLQEAVEALGQSPACEDLRAVGYSLLPFAFEILGASQGAKDPFELREALKGMQGALEARKELIQACDGAVLFEEIEGLPMKGRGVFAFRGFAWLDS